MELDQAKSSKHIYLVYCTQTMHRHLLAASVFSSLLVSAISSGFDFYKLSLIWPPSSCNVGAECRSPIPSIFTIHGLWPQFADDTAVPSYETDPTCTTLTPVSPDNILTYLQPIEARLKVAWPNLKNTDDSQFWKVEWRNHGMCSDYANDPYGFFNAVLTLRSNARYDPLKVLGITPGDTFIHRVSAILNNVKRNVGAYPQIACNTLPGGIIKQLWEVRFCFDRAMPPSVLRDCPNKLAGTCSSESEFIRFPPVPPIRLEEM